MATITIVDECLAPEKYIYVTYKGPNPFGVAEKISETVRPFFHVSASGTAQTRLNWDSSGDPIAFFSTWWVKKDLSRFTKMWVYIKVQGSKSKADNMGEFTMQLNGSLETKFEGFSAFLKPFWLMYSYLFYDRARRHFIERCRNFVVNFRNEVKEHFGLEVTSVPTARGSYG